MRGKLIFAALLVVLASGCTRKVAVNPPTQNLDHLVTATWKQSFADNKACSSTVTTSCISGFNEGYVIGSTKTQLHTDAVNVCSGTGDPLACGSSFNAVLPLGPVVFYVETTGVDQNGAATVSATYATAPSVTVTLDAPTNPTFTVQ